MTLRLFDFSPMKKRDWIIVGLVVCMAIGLFIYLDRVQILELVRSQNKRSLPAPVTYTQVQENQVNKKPVPSDQTTNVKPVVIVPLTNVNTETEKQFRTEINLAVPFTSQAPTGNWQLPYKELCEEASVLMVHEYFAGNDSATIDPIVAEKALQEIVAFENTLFGYYLDTTVSETAQFAEQLYGLAKSDILENPTVDQIKEHLNRGEPVLVPAYGIALKNPYYTQPGPVYHMLVIKGYTKDNQFITNDPGTKHGAGYVYSFDTIMNAMHDWNAQDMLQGKKAALVLHSGK